jgi:hypothetical protein
MVQFLMRDDSSLHDAPSAGLQEAGRPSSLDCRAVPGHDTFRFMPTPADALRRWLGLLCLALAGGMLIWGQTVLKPHLQGLWFLIYWAICFLLTFGAIGIALLDMRAVRKRLRSEQETLIKQTLANLEKDAESSPSQAETAKGTSDPTPRPKSDNPG